MTELPFIEILGKDGSITVGMLFQKTKHQIVVVNALSSKTKVNQSIQYKVHKQISPEALIVIIPKADIKAISKLSR